MNQAEVLYHYNKATRDPFNPDIFKRDENKIIYYLEQMLLSCQRTMGVEGYFTLHIENFTVVEGYKECREILAKYQEAAINKSAKIKAAMDNRYTYIDLKPTDLKLLIVTFKIETYEGVERFENIIAIPRIVDKFFVNINNNKRSILFQLVESTYNNATSSSKHRMITLKSIFNAIRVFRHVDTKTTTKREAISLVTFDADIFKKSVPIVVYLFAKMGYINTIRFLGLENQIYLTNYEVNDDRMFTFCPRKTSGMFISCPKNALLNNPVLQHVVNTMCLEFTKKAAVYPDILGREAWIYLLGRHFNLATPYEKGVSVLSSLSLIYDNVTKETIYLPEEDKADIYTIFRWMLYEYDALYLKNNLDLRYKRVRCEEYIAAIFAPKLSKAIYALSDLGDRVTLKQIRKRLAINPLYIIDELAICSLSNYHDMVSDVDAFVATKESNQGISGISDGTSKSLPDSYLYLNQSHIGILGLSESSPSSIGASSNLTPYTKIDDHGYFSLWNYQEPNTFRNRIYQANKAAIEEMSLKQVVYFDNPEYIMKQTSECKELKTGKLEISPKTLEKLKLMNK